VTRLLVSNALPVEKFLQDITRHPPLRVPGTAVFMSGNTAGTPAALVQNVRHNHVLHERNILLTARTEQRPRVDAAERVQVEPLGHGFWRVIVHYGFTEEPDIPAALSDSRHPALALDPHGVTYFLGRETLIPTTKVEHMAVWRERLFVAMSRNATNATSYFCLPIDQVIELGAHVEI
jgi:KUP system potassium uptake protein